MPTLTNKKVEQVKEYEYDRGLPQFDAYSLGSFNMARGTAPS
jgi:hypothetical protein